MPACLRLRTVGGATQNSDQDSAAQDFPRGLGRSFPLILLGGAPLSREDFQGLGPERPDIYIYIYVFIIIIYIYIYIYMLKNAIANYYYH